MNAPYTFDFDNNTISLSKVFARKARVVGSEEFRMLVELHKQFPDFKFKTRESAKKENYKGLTLEQMIQYIKAQDNKDALMISYNRIVALYGREVEDKENPGQTVVRAPYTKVKSWFLAEFPNYGKEDFTTKSNAQPAGVQQ